MASSEATTDQFLTAMHSNQPVLQGVGVVVQVSENAVLDFVKNEWGSSTEFATRAGTVVWCGKPAAAQGDSVATITQIGFELDAPIIQSGNSGGVTINFGIHSVELKVGTLVIDGAFDPEECGCVVDDPKANWKISKELDLPADAQLQVTLPFSLDRGVTSTGVHSVVLEFAAGKFALNNLSADGLDGTEFTHQLQRWFAEKQPHLTVASVHFSTEGEMATLNPVSLNFDVVQSKSGASILRLLIATEDGVAQGSPCIGLVNLDEPIPTDSGMDFSVIISSKIMFEDVVERFNEGTGLVKLVAAPPDSEEPSWYAKIRNPMSYEGSITWGDVWEPVKNNTELGLKFTGSKEDGLALSSYTIPGGNIDLEMAVSGHYPIKISGEGTGQQIAVGKGSSTLTYADGVAESAVKAQLEDFLKNDIFHDVTAISFDRVASFVLKSLEFPGHLAAMVRAEVPGEFVIVGSLEKKSK